MRFASRAMCLLAPLLTATMGGQTPKSHGPSAANSRLAIASFAPLNTDLFIANADGSEPRPFLPHSALDYNASFSADGRWIVFTSERGGSADIYRAHPDGSGLERLTDDPAFDDQGALSPDGRSLVFVSSRSGQADIWVLDIARRTLRDVSRHPAGDFRPAWSPDGRWIAFTSERDSKRPHQGFTTLQSTEIYLVHPDGSALRRLTTGNAYEGSASWSADGARLLVYEVTLEEVAKIVAPRRLRATTQIASIDVATGARQSLTSGAGEKWSPRYLPDGRVGYASGGPTGGLEFVTGVAGSRGEFGGPSWSPDGRRMVFHRDVEQGWPPLRAWPSRDPRLPLMRTGVFASYSPAGDELVMNDGTAGISHNSIVKLSADGTHRVVLVTDSVRSALAPSWSPRGDRIAFALGRFFPAILGASSAAIAVVGADGTGLTVLTDSTGNAGFPSWAPDGHQIVFRVSDAGRSALRILDAESRAVHPLTTGTSNDNSPAWSPLGDRIAFTAKAEGEPDYDIFTIRPDGSGLQRLTSSPGNDSHPAWSPDGAWIAFTSARGGFKDEAPLHPYNPQPYGDIYVMRADGSGLRQITDNQFEDGTPTWVPAARAHQGRGARK